MLRCSRVDCRQETKEQPRADRKKRRLSQSLPRIAEGRGPKVGLLAKEIRESRDRSLRVRGWSEEGGSGDESLRVRGWRLEVEKKIWESTQWRLEKEKD